MELGLHTNPICIADTQHLALSIESINSAVEIKSKDELIGDKLERESLGMTLVSRLT